MHADVNLTLNRPCVIFHPFGEVATYQPHLTLFELGLKCGTLSLLGRYCDDTSESEDVTESPGKSSFFLKNCVGGIDSSGDISQQFSLLDARYISKNVQFFSWDDDSSIFWMQIFHLHRSG